MTGELAIAVLAAGSARRFGGGKLDRDCAGKPLGRWALDSAHFVRGAQVAVVVGMVAPKFPDDAELIWNGRAARGLGTSVAAAAAWAAARSADALLVMLADMPLVSSATLGQLARGPLPAAVAYPTGRPGVPACFPARMFERLHELDTDGGAGRLLAECPDLRLVEIAAEELRDVDRPGDLADVAAILELRNPLRSS